MKKSKFIDYAVLMAARSNRRKRQEKTLVETSTYALTDKKHVIGQTSGWVINAITIAVLAEGLRA